MLGGGVHAVHGDRRGRLGAAQVDDRAAVLAQVFGGDGGAVVGAPEVGFEQAPMVRVAGVLDLADHRDAGVVHPGIETAELLDGEVGDLLHGLAIADVGCQGDHLIAAAEFAGDLLQRLLVARHQHQAGALGHGGARGGQADAAGGAGDDDDLLGERTKIGLHGVLLCGERDTAKALQRGQALRRSRSDAAMRGSACGTGGPRRQLPYARKKETPSLGGDARGSTPATKGWTAGT